MVQLTKRGLDNLADLRKRTARDFGSGKINKETFDQLFNLYNKIEEIFNKIDSEGE